MIAFFSELKRRNVIRVATSRRDLSAVSLGGWGLNRGVHAIPIIAAMGRSNTVEYRLENQA
jgi:hypothetical protein